VFPRFGPERPGFPQNRFRGGAPAEGGPSVVATAADVQAGIVAGSGAVSGLRGTLLEGFAIAGFVGLDRGSITAK
jgi:hypothetical protein